MKLNPARLLGICLLLSLSAACGGPIESFTFQSPGGDRKVEVEGRRESPAGPIVVTVTLTSPGGTRGFDFEHQAGSLTQDNLKAEWLDNTRCNLTFTMGDGTSWLLECFLLDDKVQAVKNFTIDGKNIFK
jgi:hypothetical protein